MAGKKTPIEEYNEGLSAEQRSENARRAAIASGEARRAHRLFRDILKDILSAPLETESDAYEALQRLGLKNPRQEDAIMLAAAKKAADGDVESIRFIRDTVGEKPTESFNVGVQGKPIQALDLSKLTDEELEALADGQ